MKVGADFENYKGQVEAVGGFCGGFAADSRAGRRWLATPRPAALLLTPVEVFRGMLG